MTTSSLSVARCVRSEGCVTADPNEEESDQLYSIFNDGTLVTMAGEPQVHFHREAPSLEDAIASAVVHVRKAGFEMWSM